jgi:hypothetical protein
LCHQTKEGTVSDDKYGKLRVIKGEAEAPQGEYKRAEQAGWDSNNPTAPSKGDGYRTVDVRELNEARRESETLRRRLRESMRREQRRLNEQELAARFERITNAMAAYDGARATLATTLPAFAPAAKALGDVIKRLAEEVYALAVHASSPRADEMRDDDEEQGDAVGRMMRQMLGDDWNVVPLGRIGLDDDGNNPNIG